MSRLWQALLTPHIVCISKRCVFVHMFKQAVHINNFSNKQNAPSRPLRVSSGASLQGTRFYFAEKWFDQWLFHSLNYFPNYFFLIQGQNVKTSNRWNGSVMMIRRESSHGGKKKETNEGTYEQKGKFRLTSVCCNLRFTNKTVLRWELTDVCHNYWK